jgi:hypothetical protein
MADLLKLPARHDDGELKFLGWKGPKVGKRLIEDAAKSFKRGSAKPPDG